MVINIKTLGSLLATAMLLSFSGEAIAKDTKGDNTGLNKRDRSATELTADSQHSKRDDMDLTRRIRREIFANKSLSTYAANVKVITLNGRVTLKGPVRSETELNTIVKIAEHVAGPQNITSQIGIVPKEIK